MFVRSPNNVGRAVQTDPTLPRYASAIKEQKKFYSCWLKSLTGFKLCAATPNNTQQHATGCAMQTDATCNIYQCWEPRLYETTNDVALVFIKSFSKFECNPLLETEILKISIN